MKTTVDFGRCLKARAFAFKTTPRNRRSAAVFSFYEKTALRIGEPFFAFIYPKLLTQAFFHATLSEYTE